MRVALDHELVVDAGRRPACIRQIAMLDRQAGATELARDVRLGRTAIAEQDVAAAAERFQRADQLLVIHLVDGGMDLAAAEIGIVQEGQDLVQSIA